MNNIAELYPALGSLLNRQIELTPRYVRSLNKRFTGVGAEHLDIANKMAMYIVDIAGEHLDRVLLDYDWICRMMVREEIEFRRSGRYRLSSFKDAIEKVYSDDEFMGHYMNGLLTTQLWWSNHTNIFRFYKDTYLERFSKPFDHLEIGPGHGLYLHEAGCSPMCRTLEGWDVSETSVQRTGEALQRLGTSKPLKLKIQDLFNANNSHQAFDSIVLSEVLEHLEHPREALEVVRDGLAPGGKVFINVPVNSPAPDHIFLLRSPEEAEAMVEACGFRILESRFEPQTGMTLPNAREMNSTISVAIIAELSR